MAIQFTVGHVQGCQVVVTFLTGKLITPIVEQDIVYSYLSLKHQPLDSVRSAFPTRSTYLLDLTFFITKIGHQFKSQEGSVVSFGVLRFK